MTIAALLCSATLSAFAGGISVVRAEDFREAVRLFLVQREGWVKERMDLTFRSVPDSIGVDAPAFTLRVGMGSSNRARGPVAFVVEVVAAEQTVHRCMVTAVIRTYDTVLVADRTIAHGVAPTDGDIRRFHLETTGVERALVTDLADLFGKRTRRVIARGSLLYADMFEDLPLVYQGSSVHVLVRSGSVSVMAEGTACQDGHAGELIEVSVRGKAGRLKARVTDDCTVAVPAE
jgi:flagella basal body P-ring formation protein FlgA